MGRIRSIFMPRRDDSKLLLAQFEALSTRVPILYMLLVINAVAVSMTHIGTAPLWLAAYLPVLMSILCIIRLLWWQTRRRVPVTPEAAYRYLRRTERLAGILTLGFASWAVGLYQYGDAYQQGQIAYFLVVTGISCIFCLMHLPSAALITTAITFSFMVVTFLFSGNAVFIATALSVAFLSVAFVSVILSYFDNFSGLVELTAALERKQEETEQLNEVNSRNALHDQLTGLANRRSFFQQLDGLIGSDPHRPPVVGLVDLDGFKPVNDIFGHAAGDFVLKEAAARFHALSQGEGSVARLGGDEFGFILPGCTSREDAAALGQAFCTTLREPFEIPGGSIRLSGSCGIAYPEDGAGTSEEIYERADFALYQMKNKRGGAVEFFSSDHQQLLKRRHAIDFALQAGDFSRELSLEFQPVITLDGSRLVGFEALARWNSSRLGPVSPNDFIPAAERTGIVSRMTAILLSQALDAMKLMPDHLRLAFNLSARDICDRETALALLVQIRQSGIDVSRLDLEITETALLSDFDTAAEVVRMLRSAGASISLDDFGTGFSSLSHVHRLEFDKIKIDKSFVLKCDRDERSMNIIRSVANLCHNLSIQSVAEGIETAEIRTALQASGVDLGQGYFFSRPQPLAAVLQGIAMEDGRAAADGARLTG